MTKPAVRALLFDMDGLLLDTEWVHIAAYTEMTAHLGCPQSFESLKRFIGMANHVTCQWLIDEYRLPQTVDELMRLECGHYLEVLRRIRPQPLAGVPEAFALSDRPGLKRGLVSSSTLPLVGPTMTILAEHLGRSAPWQSHFHVICTGERVKNLKPSPEIYQLAMHELELRPEECVAFEDSPPGVKAAVAAGCRVMAVPNKYLTTADFEVLPEDGAFKSLAEAVRHVETLLA